jgi:microcystin-dependent protein
MSDPFIGEIQIYGFNFAPRGWSFCSGQILSIAQNSALFSLLGTTYGGNGIQTFGLPNMTGRTPLHTGQGSGLSNRTLGELAGSEGVTLLTTQIPSHTHTFSANSSDANTVLPTGNSLAKSSSNLYAAQNNGAIMQPLGITGGNQPHNNMQPYAVLNFCIALQGIYPSRD